MDYWAVDNNGTIEKGALVSTDEKNELRYTLDYIAQFDTDGKVIKASYTGNDTLRGYQKIDYDGLNKKISIFRLPVDTLVRSINVFNNKAGIAGYAAMQQHQIKLLEFYLYK